MQTTRFEAGDSRRGRANRRGVRAGCWAALSLLALAPGATAQCAYWRSLPPYVYNSVDALAVFDDDGDGPLPPALMVGGTLGAIGGGPQRHIGRWDGASWSPVGGDVSGALNALLVFDDDGAGPLRPALYVGGSFYFAGGVPARGVAKWDGAAWSPVGVGTTGHVSGLCAFDDDGDGPHPQALFACGSFDNFGNVSMRSAAKWDGVSWSPLALGLLGGFQYASAMAVFDDDGPGPLPPALYVGGSFTLAANSPTELVPTQGIARWNGSVWSAVGGGVNGAVYALRVFDDDGAGPHPETLYVGGTFSLAGGTPASNIATWDGAQWSAVGAGLNGDVTALAPFDDGGPAPHSTQLFAGGRFDVGGGPGTGRIAKWDGQQWLGVGEGITGQAVNAFAAYDEDRAGPAPETLFVGGHFDTAGGVQAVSIARYRELVSVAITTQPKSGPRLEGSPTALTVEAEGEILSYQWRRDGEPLVDQAPYSDVRTPTLRIDSFAQNTAADYDCVVTDPCGSLVTDPAALTVEPYCPMDVNGDGVTNFLDLNLLLSFYGETCPPRP